MNQQSQNTYSQMLECLQGMVRLYRSLLKVVRQEHEILVSANLDDLNENNKAKEAMLLKIREMEKSRIQLVQQLAEQEGLPEEKTRLLDIAVHFGGEEGDKLRNIHSVLDLLIRRVKEINKRNEEMVQSALANITGAMNAIRDTLKEKPVYQKKGEISGSSTPSGRLVSREA